jgi:hypothetical protein
VREAPARRGSHKREPRERLSRLLTPAEVAERLNVSPT